MIEWSHPQLLWLLLLVPALAALVWRRERQRRAALAALAETPLVPRLTPDLDARRRGVREGLRLTALLLLIVALAGPRWGSRWEEVKREGVDLIVALDASRSMLATDVKPNRLERAKLAVLDLLGKLRGDRVGLVAFSGTAFLECPLTLDYGAFRASLATMSAGIIPRGGTNLAAAIETAVAGFEARQGKYEALILITDGESTEGEYEAAAKKAAELGVRIYTVGIGTSAGELIPAPGSGETWVKNRAGEVVKSRLDEKALQDIALATGGAYVHGAGASLGLDEIFDGHIARMERRELQSTLQRRFENRFQIPLALALLLLLLEPLLGERRRLAAVALALALLAPRAALADAVGEGNRFYHLGKYDEAAQQYGDALVESPGSPLLRFNLAAAQYKQGKFSDAVASLEKIGATGDASFDARVAYNLGNSLVRQAQSQDESQPPEAVKAYETALLAYKRAMGLAPEWQDPKVNHEIAAQELEALKKRIEEERKKQEEEQQQQQEQQQDQQQQDQQQQDQQQQDQQQQDQQQQDQQQQPPEDPQGQPQPEQEEPNQSPEQQQPQPQPQPGDEQQEPGGAGAPEQAAASEEELDRQEAHGVVDTARDEEVRPEELKRLRGPAAVLEPAEDW